MQGEPSAIKWTRQLGIAESVELLPALPHPQMGDVFRLGQLVVSLGVHDGTPNTLLEGMACGCLPVAGDLESIREWIKDRRNGLLVDSRDPASVANALVEGLNNNALRLLAAGLNEELIRERADYTRCMAAAQRFYERVISTHQ
jgi:glycosyltransferase involved in cell wall biosynthesis